MHSRLRSPDELAAVVFGRQHGAISGRQALATGLTRRQVDLRVHAGRWRRLQRDVFVLAGAPDTWQQRAMVAYLAVAGIGGVLSYVTAGAMFSVLAPSTLPHVTVPPGSSARCRLAKVHRQVVPAQDYQHRDGVIVTTPSRLLVDMARVLGRAPLEELVDDVFCRGLTSIDSVATSLERAGLGHHGHALLRDVIDVWSPTIEPGSIAEIRLLRLLGELGATGLVTQHEVLDANGAFIGRLDVARPDRKCGLEYDSIRFHGPRQWERDERRYGQLRAAGWDVEGVTKADLVPGATRLATISARWLSAEAA